MEPAQQTGGSRAAFYVSFAVIGLLGVLSVIWYRQRMLFVDPAFIAFEIIQYKGFMISERRYGSFITQMWPLIGSSLGWSLKTILIVYSASFYAFYLSVAALVGFAWKQYGLVTLLALYLTLVVSDVYFWPNNEIHQAVGWMMLFLGLYFSAFRRRLRWYEHILLVSFAFLATVTHMLAAAPIAFLWVYLHLSRVGRLRELRRGRVYGYSAVVVVGIAVRYLLSKQGWYDNVKLGAVSNLSLERIANTFTSGQAITMWEETLVNYWLLFPVLGLGVYATLRRGRGELAVITLLAGLAYFILICMTYAEAFDRTHLFYFESEWMAGGMILATPFVLELLTGLRWSTATVALLLIFGIRLYYISDGYDYFNTRLENHAVLSDELRKVPGRKAILKPAAALDDYFGMHWGVPVESLYFSVLAGDTVSTTLKIERSNPAEVDTSRVGLYLGAFRGVPITSMNERYHRLADSTYVILNEAQLTRLRSVLTPLPE